MKVSEINKILSPRQLAGVVLVYVAFIQLFITIYLDYINYAPISSISILLYRYLMSVAIAFLGGYIVAYLDLRVIAFLDYYASWNGRIVKRVIFEILFVSILGVFTAFLLTGIASLIHKYPESFYCAFINNIMISIVSNFMLMIILEFWVSLFEKNKSELKEQIMESEISNLKYEVLKSQIEPHFIFNSLNTMSGLIGTEPERAQKFFDELSLIYRYVLETIDSKCVRLSQELEFLESYRFLLEIRFSNKIIFHIQKTEEYLDWWLPPLCLQFAVENALKHNSLSDISPLMINIYCQHDSIYVVNNVQYKYSREYSSGIGQRNINKRYAIITEILPIYFSEGGKYYSKFPLLPEKPKF